MNRLHRQGLTLLLMALSLLPARAMADQALSCQKPSFPFLSHYPFPITRFHLDMSYTRFEDLDSLAFLPALEWANERRTFGFDVRWGLGSGETFLVSDMLWDFKWVVHRSSDFSLAFTVGFQVALPTTLLNFLDNPYTRQGKAVYEKGLLPIHYGETGPFVLFTRRLSAVTLQAEVGVQVWAQSRNPDAYEAPVVAARIFYNAMVAVEVARFMQLMVEFNGISTLTEPPSTGLTITPGLRFTIAPRFMLGLAVPASLLPSDRLGRYDFSPFTRHRVSVLSDFSFFF